jgi:hypothetical protein
VHDPEVVYVSSPDEGSTVHPVVPALATEYVMAPPPVEAEASALGVSGDAVVRTAVVGLQVTVVAAGSMTTSRVVCGAGL